jgi:hypothetical protein
VQHCLPVGLLAGSKNRRAPHLLHNFGHWDKPLRPCVILVFLSSLEPLETRALTLPQTTMLVTVSTPRHSPTVIYEDNVACVAQMHIGYVKSNIIKHIAAKFFYPHELQKSSEIHILQTKSCKNLADLFTKYSLWLPHMCLWKGHETT